jgi:protein TonB
MFEEMVVSTSGAKKTSKPWTMALSMLLQVGLLAILILIPLIYTEALPKTLMSSILLAPPPPPPPPPPPAAVQVVKVKPMAHLMDAGKLVAPKVIPKDVKIIKEEEAPPDMGGGMVGGVPGGVSGGSMGGVLGGVIGGAGSSMAPPPPPKATPKRITVGGNVQAAHLVNRVQPSYPPLARQTRISGTVKLHAIIGKDGTVQQLQVVSGHPLLVQSALDAVRQWRYQPTLLNGDPVEVDTEIDVIFSLAQ